MGLSTVVSANVGFPVRLLRCTVRGCWLPRQDRVRFVSDVRNSHEVCLCGTLWVNDAARAGPCLRHTCPAWCLKEAPRGHAYTPAEQYDSLLRVEGSCACPCKYCGMPHTALQVNLFLAVLKIKFAKAQTAFRARNAGKSRTRRNTVMSFFMAAKSRFSEYSAKRSQVRGCQGAHGMAVFVVRRGFHRGTAAPSAFPVPDQFFHLVHVGFPCSCLHTHTSRQMLHALASTAPTRVQRPRCRTSVLGAHGLLTDQNTGC